MKKTLIALVLLISLQTAAQSIFRTACQGKLARLDSMLTNKSVSIKDNKGRSLLHWAVACEKQNVFDYLIKKGININSEDPQQNTPLHIAARYNLTSYFDQLTALQTNTEWVKKYGATLLESAIINKSEPLVSKLIAFGADVNQPNKRGSVPLELAKRLKATKIYSALLTAGADENKIRTFTMKGKYMGQQPPGKTAQLFAPNFISTEAEEFGAVFNKAGDEFYFGAHINGKSEIKYSKMVENVWTEPKTILVHPKFGYNDPFLSNDEKRLYFISSQALDTTQKPKDIDIWYIQKTPNGWSAPINAGASINTQKDEYYISFTNNGTMYFASNGHHKKDTTRTDHDIYYSKLVDNKYQKPVNLGSSINSNDYEADVFIAPDESYIIYCATRDGSFGRGDLYISFKKSDNTWTPSKNMGSAVNTKNYEYCPFVSKDGKYLFYTSNQDIYWISTTILDDLKPKKEEE